MKSRRILLGDLVHRAAHWQHATLASRPLLAMFVDVPVRAYDWALPMSLSAAAAADGASDKCLLFTDAYGRLMQVVLAATALVVMYIKRKLETPMRPLRVWALDLGKQCCGAFLIHCLTILLAIIFVAEAGNNDDECGIYFVTYMLDTTWGIVVILGFLRLIHSVAEYMEWQDVTESGFYGEPPQLSIWAKQLAAYAVAVLLMKLLDSLIILAFYKKIASFATALFSSFTEHRHLELLLVMIIIPGCCNSFQFWIVDSYLKCDGSHWKYFTARVTSDDEQEEHTKPLLSSTGPSLVVSDQPTLVLTSTKTTSYDSAANSRVNSSESEISRPEYVT